MEFITLFFTTTFVFAFQKILQFLWDKFFPKNKNIKRGKQYGKK